MKNNKNIPYIAWLNKKGHFDMTFVDEDKTPKKGFKRFEFTMDRITDNDIIEWLEKQPNKGLYIRTLIKKDMEKRL